MTIEADIEPNPSVANIRQGFAVTRSHPKDFGKFLKIYKSVNNAPFVLDADDVAASLRILILSHFEAYPASLNEAAEKVMWERSEDRDYFAELVAKESGNLLIAAEGHLGTHTAKVPNPGVTGPGGLFADKAVFDAASHGAHVSSATFSAKQKIGAAGNAAQGKAQRFLASRVLIGSEMIDVSEDISQKGAIFAAMLEIGFEREVLDELSEVLTSRMSGLGDTTPGLNAKGLIWPTDEGDVVITPVHSYAMHVELTARIKQRIADPACKIPWTHIVVGGTKPQNAGLINSDMGGWHRLLKSRPPHVGNSSRRKLFRIAKTGEIPLAELTSASPAVKGFLRTANAVWENNDVARMRLENSIASLVRIAIIPLMEASSLDAAILNGDEFKKVSKPLRDLLIRGFRNVNDRSELVRNTADGVIDQIPAGVEFSDALRRLFYIAAEDVLAAQFKGV